MRPTDHFERAALALPSIPAFIAGDSSLSYGDARAQVLAIAAVLHRLGPKDGETKIAVYSPNDVTAMLCVLAVLRTGAVWVPINARNAVEENAAVIERADCSILIAHSEFAERCLTNRVLFPKLEMLITMDKELDGAAYLGTLLAQARHQGRLAIADNPARVSAILSTSGTTGLPKGCGLDRSRLGNDDRKFLDPHAVRRASGLSDGGADDSCGGCTGVPIVRRCRNCDRARATGSQSDHRSDRKACSHPPVPAANGHLRAPRPSRRPVDQLFFTEVLHLYAAPMAVEKLKRAIEIFGPVMTQLYGQAEAPAMATFFGPAEHVEALSRGDENRLWSCGRPCMLTDADILSPEGRPTRPFEPGEIVLRGNLVSPLYYRDAEATAGVKRNGWHHTGDVGHRDQDGFIYIVDRKKDMIVSGGFNVYSAEVEKVILAHLGVRECAVIGVPDDKWGEAVKAIVEPNTDVQLDPAEIVTLCKTKLGGVKAPKSIEIWDELPRSANGKVLKRKVRDQYWLARRRAV